MNVTLKCIPDLVLANWNSTESYQPLFPPVAVITITFPIRALRGTRTAAGVRWAARRQPSLFREIYAVSQVCQLWSVLLKTMVQEICFQLQGIHDMAIGSAWTCRVILGV